ncbi:MAG: glutathione S-transferase family protein [Caulobacteraceae bacterium]|nr:glutathione S-transferase family protein [Caulobacteraceae bacterium]
MILIGQYDSPFVRRVAVALRLYGIAYEYRPWSTFGDGDRIAQFNPLRRVPTLVLDGGEALIDSFAILDHLDELAGPSRALIASSGPERRAALRVCALATGLCDKMVSLVYERALHETVSPAWTVRCEIQIGDVLEALENECARRAGAFWFGDRLGHPDIAVACALRFLDDAHPGLASRNRRPALADHAARCEAIEAFAAVSQTLSVTAR